MKLRTLYTATALIIASGVANADPITITNGFGTTDVFTTLGATDIPVTSTYINSAGISQGSEATDLVGTTLAFTDAGSATIGQLSPLLGSVSTVGYGDDWVLDFTYSLSGTAMFVDDILGVFADGSMDAVPADGIIDGFDAIIPSYDSGTFEFFYRTLTGPISTTKVLEVDLTGFAVSGPSVVLNGEVDYSWFAGPDSLVEDFFTHATSGDSFYEIAETALVPQEISFRTDFNVDPNRLPTCVDAACATLTRDTDLNISAVFSVPEPTSIAILGLGLLGLGLRRKTKV